MNQQIENFVNKLKDEERTEGVLLFGSWARGNNRSNSDVDLLVIVSDGYSREIEEYEGKLFEIVYSTKESAIDYWKSDMNGCANLWEVGQILYSKGNQMENLKTKAKTLLMEGKQSLKNKEIERLLFNAEDQLKSACTIAKKNVSHSNFLIHNHVFELTSIFFDLHKEWTPAPKQRLEKIKEMNLDLYSKLTQFYKEEIKLNDKFILVDEIIDLIFNYQF